MKPRGPNKDSPAVGKMTKASIKLRIPETNVNNEKNGEKGFATTSERSNAQIF